MKSIKLFYLLPLIAVLFAACSRDAVEDTTAAPQQEVITDFSIEMANPEGGIVSEVYFAGQKVPVEIYNDIYVYQGDILLPENLVTSQPVKIYEKGEIPPGSSDKSVGRTSGRWPNSTVFYAIDPDLTKKERVYDAIEHWENNTNLNFIPRTTETNYIYFDSGIGCSSYVGMIGGKQKITLSFTCSTGNTIHEIGHAVGLWHEQSRVDRNDYLIIQYDNIEEGKEHNFQTYAERRMDGAEYTAGLDFNSIMMYGPYSFSSNGLPTITKKDGDTYQVQRSILSSGDKEGLDNMYPYSPESEVVEETYVNGKYYVVNNILVYRMHDRWYFYSDAGWREVQLEKDHWFYA